MLTVRTPKEYGMYGTEQLTTPYTDRLLSLRVSIRADLLYTVWYTKAWPPDRYITVTLPSVQCRTDVYY